MRSLWLSIGILSLIPLTSFAQGEWSMGSSFQMTQGDYVSGNTTTNYYFNVGGRHRAEAWYISTTLSLIVQDGLFSESTTNNVQDGSEASYRDIGIGDINVFSEINLLKGTNTVPWISFSSQLKIPTASAENYFGTGEFDFGFGFTFRKKLFSFVAFGDIGYLNLGDSEQITYLNPLTFGIGVGKGFEYGKYSLSIYYQRYTKIYETYQAPHQLSLGLYINIIKRTYLSFIGSKGLSETSPNFSISAGLEYYL